MNTALTIYCALIILSEANCFYTEETSNREDFERQAIILRKLQSLQERVSRNATQATWSEILADVLVKEIFSHKIAETNKKTTKSSPEKSTSVLVKAVSRILEIYKTYVFDRMRSDYSNVGVIDGYTDKLVSSKSNKVEKNVPNINITSNPKEEVELIEPKYHGKLIDNGTSDAESNNDCDEGFKRDANGNCVQVKASKYILSIPWQCPIGYRLDWLGYCRATL